MVETLASAADVRLASDGDLLVTQLVTRWVPEPSSLRYGGAVAVWSNFWGPGECAIVGPAADAAALLMAIDPADMAAAREISVVAAALPLLPGGYPLGETVPWAFRWTDTPSARPVPAGTARWLDTPDDKDVAELLDRGFPDASIRPGDPHLRRFAGIRDPDGRLVACAGDATGDDTLGFLASIASDPDRRGRGLGTAISAWATEELLRAHGRVGLWHMTENLAANAVYTALGYRDEHRMVALLGAAPVADP